MNPTPLIPFKPHRLASALLACSLMLAACSGKDKAPAQPAGAPASQPPATSAAAAASAPATEAPPGCLITETNIGQARLGMTYAEFRQAYGDTHELVSANDIKDTKKWENTAAADTLGRIDGVLVFPKHPAGAAQHADPRNALVYTLFADSAIEFGKPMPDKAVLVEVGTLNPQCRTAEGVGPQQAAKEALKHYKEFVIKFPRTHAEGEDPTNGMTFTARPAIHFVLDLPLEQAAYDDAYMRIKYDEKGLKPDNAILTEALIHHDFETDIAKSQVAPEQALEQDRNRPKTCRITATGMDRAELGMTYAELKKAYAGELSQSDSSRILMPNAPQRYERLSGVRGEGLFGIQILLDQGGALYGLAPPETAKVIGLLSLDERCLTAEGVHAGQLVAEAAKVYGKARPGTRGKAEVTFEQQPEGLQFDQVEKRVANISVGKYFGESE